MSISEIWERHLSSKDSDVALPYAKKHFLNKSKEDIYEQLDQSVIDISDEYRIMPDVLFNYYFHHFNDYILSEQYSEFDATMVSDCYLSLLNEKISNKSITNKDLINQSKDVVDFISSKIDIFNSDKDIYGDLQERLSNILLKLSAYEIK